MEGVVIIYFIRKTNASKTQQRCDEGKGTGVALLREFAPKTPPLLDMLQESLFLFVCV
jgi:hypothetical protein